MSINPSIFKAYDVRGLYPSEVNEDAARLIQRLPKAEQRRNSSASALTIP